MNPYVNECVRAFERVEQAQTALERAQANLHKTLVTQRFSDEDMTEYVGRTQTILERERSRRPDVMAPKWA